MKQKRYRAHVALTALLLAFMLAIAPLSPHAAFADVQPLTLASSSSTPLEATYDSRDAGYISAPRLQEPWGACWAFGSLAAMEANLVKQGLISNSTYLSPRHLIYFAGTPVGEEAGAQVGEGQYPSDAQLAEYPENSVFELGGHALEVASTISSGEGVAFEANYPYKNDPEDIADTGRSYSTHNSWALPETERYVAEFALQNMHRLPDYGAVGDSGTFAINASAMESIKDAIRTYGAVSVSYCSRDEYYNAQSFASFTNADRPQDRAVDHDVCIVGWADNYPRENFTTGTGAAGNNPEGDGAWIVKNSWGAETNSFPDQNSWGEAGSGYCYLSFYDRSATGFTAWEMAPITTSITHQHDYMGQRSNAETRIADYSPVSYANIFVADENEILQAVSVNTYAPNTQVNVDIYLLENADAPIDPTAGTLLGSTAARPAWAGYHRLEFASPIKIKKGQRFAVVVSATEADGTPVASIEAGNNIASVDRFRLTHYDTVICNAGETSVLATIDGARRWVDGTEFAALLHENAYDAAWYGNACIKVYANPAPEPQPSLDLDPTPGKDETQATGAHTSSRVQATPTAHTAPVKAHSTAKTADVTTPAITVLVLLVLCSGLGIFGSIACGAGRGNIGCLCNSVRRIGHRS